eukprot:501179_1
MASPAAKRRKIDQNAEPLNEGYDTDLFVNSADVDRYSCPICRCVFKEPYTIGCNKEHIFCKSCLDGYFTPINSTKSCPLCRHQGLSKNDIE